MYSIGFLILILTPGSTSNLYVNISGDIVLGGLFPIHRKGPGTVSCGKIQLEDGFQPLEAMLYTVQKINADPNILPGIRLGVLAFDSCEDPSHALEQILNFIKGFITHVNTYHKMEFECSDGSVPKFQNGGYDNVVAVLAAQSSSITLQVASILRLFSVPQISYMATTPTLSSKERFPHFFRTVPSDVNQAHAMLEILKQFEWTYVSIVYSDTEYGNHGFEILVSLASKYSICFSAPQRIDKERFTPEDYDNVISTIVKRTEVRVIVVFAEKVTTIRVLEAALRVNVGNHFVWIGSNAWSSPNHRGFPNPAFRLDHELAVLEGAIAVQPLFRNMYGFDEYFTNLDPSHVEVNPWFTEFWKEYHRCGYKNERRNVGGKNASKPFDMPISCWDSRRKIAKETGYKQHKSLHFVRDAVYSVAYALHDMYVDKCGKDSIGLCPAMSHIDGDVLSKYLSRVSFKDEAGNIFRFINGIDGPPRYSILNYQKGRDGIYRWRVVGNYTQSENGTPILHVDQTAIKYRNPNESGRMHFPNSTCANPCRPDQVKVREKQDPCCWHCRDCGQYQYKSDTHRCSDCFWDKIPSKDKSKCEPLPEEFMDYSSPWTVVAMAVATLGILLTIFFLVIFWLYGETPVIKAAGRELSRLMLFGTFASFLMTFALIAKPTKVICAIIRFGIGLCFTLCYAALVTKTNRIHRIFNNTNQSPHKPRYTSPQSQMVITGILTFIEVIINSIWLLKVPARAVYAYPSRETRFRLCRSFSQESLLLGLIYPFFLIIICTIYAVKTRKCPEGFNETRYIAFTNYTTIVLWVAFVPLYLASASNATRVVIVSLSLSFSALVQLGCLFFPKVYIVVMKPEKNTRELVMSCHRSSSFLPAPPTPVVILNRNPFSNSSLRSSQSREK